MVAQRDADQGSVIVSAQPPEKRVPPETMRVDVRF